MRDGGKYSFRLMRHGSACMGGDSSSTYAPIIDVTALPVFPRLPFVSHLSVTFECTQGRIPAGTLYQDNGCLD